MTDFSLRPLAPSDAEDILAYANDWDVAKYMTDMFPHPYTIDDAYAFIARFSDKVPAQINMIIVEGKAVGAIGIHPMDDIHKKNAELGYLLGKTYWNQGIVTEAIKQIVVYAFENFEITRLFARPFGNNPASARVLEKAGFTFEYKLKKNLIKDGELLDELCYGIRGVDEISD